MGAEEGQECTCTCRSEKYNKKDFDCEKEMVGNFFFLVAQLVERLP